MNPTERSIKSIRVVEKCPEDQTKPQPGTSRRNSSQLKIEQGGLHDEILTQRKSVSKKCSPRDNK